MTTNQIAYWSLKETERSNLAKEALTGRDLEEQARSNRARENETYRHNVTTEEETKRSNKQQEYLRQVDTNARLAGDIIKAGATVAKLF